MAIDEIHGGYLLHIGSNHFRIVSNDRTVEMVVAQMLVHIVGHAGIEDSLHPGIDQ